ncbi:TMEM175 family protein [Streptacidiphilus sp. PAMC 29251]
MSGGGCDVARLNDSGRVEAFSDGVFAIAITLLILEVKVPSGPGIGHQLLHHWPSYAAYVVTFLNIGIMWANHHTVFGYVARVDRVLVFLNLLLLMVCSALPWAAGLVANYLDGPDHGAGSRGAGGLQRLHGRPRAHLRAALVVAHPHRTPLRRPGGRRGRARDQAALRARHGGLPGVGRAFVPVRAADTGPARAARGVLRLQPAAGAAAGGRGAGGAAVG